MNILAKLAWAAVLCGLMGCGVKSPQSPGTGPAPLTSSGDLPKNVSYTKEKQFLVFRTNNEFKIGSVSVLYKVVSENLEVPAAPDFSYAIKYSMPEMPEMPVTAAKVEMLTVNQLRVTYDISMEGNWEFSLQILNQGKVVDSFTHVYMVQG